MKNVERIVGYLLLFPALLSIPLFIMDLVSKKNKTLNNLSSDWIGSAYGDGGYTSAIPFYFGLMAIAGAILLKNSTNLSKP